MLKNVFLLLAMSMALVFGEEMDFKRAEGKDFWDARVRSD